MAPYALVQSDLVEATTNLRLQGPTGADTFVPDELAGAYTFVPDGPLASDSDGFLHVPLASDSDSGAMAPVQPPAPPPPPPPPVPLTHEQAQIEVAQSDQHALALTLVRLNLACMSPYAFAAYFGAVRADTPYGSRLWEGMQALLFEHVRRGGRGAPPSGTVFQAGWFTAPAPGYFSAHAAQQPLDAAEVHTAFRYPAFFVVSAGAIRMWCQHILALRTRGWWVDRSRCQFIDFTIFVPM